MPLRSRAAPLVLTALLGVLPVATPAASVTLADIALVTDDNITAARDGSPRSAEQALQLGVARALSVAVDRGVSLRLVARADGRLHREHQGLNELGGSLDGQLLLRPGAGFYTPTFGFGLGIGTQRFASRLRDAQEARSRVFVQQTLTTRLAARGVLASVWRGSSSQAFDADWRSAELSLDWQVRDRLRLSLGYQYRDGTVVSVGLPGAAAVANAEGLQPDDVFTGFTAFSFDAQTHIGSVTLGYAVSPAITLETQLRYVESDTDFGTRYHRWNTISGLVLRF